MDDAPGKLPSLNGLRAFEVAARHLNFRLAAEELGVTQGAVAQQVRGLEAELGVKLFERLPRTLALTGEGRRYIADIRRAFEIIARATGRPDAAAGQAHDQHDPDLRVEMADPAPAGFHGATSRPRSAYSRHRAHVEFPGGRCRSRRPVWPTAIRAGPGDRAAVRTGDHRRLQPACCWQDGDRRRRRRISLTITLLHDAHNFWPEFVEKHLGRSEQASFKGISFRRLRTRSRPRSPGKALFWRTRISSPETWRKAVWSVSSRDRCSALRTSTWSGLAIANPLPLKW